MEMATHVWFIASEKTAMRKNPRKLQNSGFRTWIGNSQLVDCIGGMHLMMY